MSNLNQDSEKNINWKGNKVKYSSLHTWVRNHKPKTEFCEICRIKEPKQLANISGEYKRDINDFLWLCTRCHVIRDGTIKNLKFYGYFQLNKIGGNTK